MAVGWKKIGRQMHANWVPVHRLTGASRSQYTFFDSPSAPLPQTHRRHMSHPTTDPADLAGAETLEIMQAAPRYNAWQFRRITPYLGRRICEVGAGIGNMSALIHAGSPDLLVLGDTDTHYREVLRGRFASHPEVVVEELT